MNARITRIALAMVWLVLPVAAQTSGNTVTAVQVPRVIRITGTLSSTEAASGADAASSATAMTNNETALPRSAGVVGVTFALYAEETGGAPLWLETQNVQLDNSGHYSVLLGSTQAEGLPIELFTSGQAQWLGVQQQGQAEQPRIMLLSVPYALKAGDAETFGGKPPSAYAPAPPSQTDSASGGSIIAVPGSGTAPSKDSPHPLPITGSGTTNYLPIWSSASNLASSVVYQASNGGLGIGTTSPQALLDVEGGNAPVAVAAVTTQPNSSAIYGQNVSTTGNGSGVYGTSSSSNGAGVFGTNTSTTGLAVGVAGSSTSSNGVGVAGVATNTSGQGIPAGVSGTSMSPTGIGGIFTNSAISGAALGVFAITKSAVGYGVAGVAVNSSLTGPGIDLPIGVWGDTNVGGGVGVAGSADDGIAVEGTNDSTNIATADFENTETSSDTAPILLAHATNIGGSCLIDVSGNLICTGSKSAVVTVDSGSRNVALYAVEAAENWFEDFGSGQLNRGATTVHLEAIFAQTVNSDVEYHVFLTPTGDCKGLYVTNKTASSFEVRELGGGTSSIGFEYRIMARRKGYEDIRLADKTEQFKYPLRDKGKTEEAPSRTTPKHGLQQSFAAFTQLPKFNQTMPALQQR